MKKKFLYLIVLASFFVCGNSVAQGTWTNYSQKDVLLSNRIQTMMEDSKGNMWIGTRKGLSEFDGKSWSNYTQENGLADNVVNTIHEDQNGNIWVGTGDFLVARRGGGVSMFDGKNWTIYTKNDKLIGKNIYRIEEDSQGNLWFITPSRGISKYTPEISSLRSDL